MPISKLVLLGSISLLCLTLAANAVGLQDNRTPLSHTRTLGTPRSFRNLTLIPVYDTAASSANKYLTLDEALKAKVIRVREAKGSGEVNTLFLSNLSKKPIYLMAGEVVLGGQQDRCVGEDQVLAPHKRNVAVTVFCVEHGRWNGRADFQESAQMVASADIRREAQGGVFAASQPTEPANRVSGGQRMVVTGRRTSRPGINSNQTADLGVSNAQQNVWDKVALKNRRFRSETDTGTYRNTLNMTKGDAKKSISPYVKALSGSLDKDPHLVGMVAAINGKVVAADTFGNSTLFRKLWMKLLRSYAADAAENATIGKKAPAVTAGMAKDSLLSAYDSKARLTNKTAVSETTRLEASHSVLYFYKSKASGSRGVVHESLLTK